MQLITNIRLLFNIVPSACDMVCLKEKSKVLGELVTKATMTTQILNSIDGITCNEVMGAMYAFPKITLPQKAIDEAKVGSFSVTTLVHVASI